MNDDHDHFTTTTHSMVSLCFVFVFQCSRKYGETALECCGDPRRSLPKQLTTHRHRRLPWIHDATPSPTSMTLSLTARCLPALHLYWIQHSVAKAECGVVVALGVPSRFGSMPVDLNPLREATSVLLRQLPRISVIFNTAARASIPQDHHLH
jgi:hypothetical protein